MRDYVSGQVTRMSMCSTAEVVSIVRRVGWRAAPARAEDASGGINDMPAGRGASETMSAVFLSTSL